MTQPIFLFLGLRHQGPEEGRDHSGRRRRVHHDGKEDPGPGRQPSIPHLPSLVLPGKLIGCALTYFLDPNELD